MFGKLPVKRDFIAVNMPRSFLLVWEQWLQGGMSASKIALGHDWLPAYLSAPLWRFWLGPEICGLPVAGAFMSSMDGVGRHFPLTIFDCGEPDDLLAQPSDSANAVWYERIEDFLLSALEPETVYDNLLAGLEQLPRSNKTPAIAANSSIVELYRAKVCRSAHPEEQVEAFLAIQVERDRQKLNQQSVWWTIGGENYAPACIVADGLPDPNILTQMLTGKFQAEAT